MASIKIMKWRRNGENENKQYQCKRNVSAMKNEIAKENNKRNGVNGVEMAKSENNETAMAIMAWRNGEIISGINGSVEQ
jgi:hypothetical protein